MPINGPGMESAFQTGFSAGYTTYAAAGTGWGNAVQIGASGIFPASTTVAAAVATLKSALTAAFATPTAIPAMETAFLAFGVTVGGGMAGYTPVPPAVPVGFAAIFSTTASSHSDAAQAVSDAIVTWLKKGKATLNVPPATVVNWS